MPTALLTRSPNPFTVSGPNLSTSLLSAGRSAILTKRAIGTISVNPTIVPKSAALFLSSSVAPSSLARSLASPAPAAPANVSPVPIAAIPAPATGAAPIAATGAAIPAIDPSA